MRIGLCVSLISAAVTSVVVAFSGGMAAAASPHCTVRDGAIAGIAHSRLIAVRGATVVYRVRSHQRDDWFACRRGSAARAAIGSQNSFQERSAEYGPSQTLAGLRIAGDWVIVVERTGVDQTLACSKYDAGFCWNPDTAILAADASSAAAQPGLVTRLLSAPNDAQGDGVNYDLSRVLLSTAGAVAWLEEAEPYGPAPPTLPWTYAIYGCVLADGADGSSCTPSQLAAGATKPTSLQLDGTTLTWTAGGQSQSAPLSQTAAVRATSISQTSRRRASRQPVHRGETQRVRPSATVVACLRGGTFAALSP